MGHGKGFWLMSFSFSKVCVFCLLEFSRFSSKRPVGFHSQWIACWEDREEAVGLYFAANNLMSLTFLGWKSNEKHGGSVGQNRPPAPVLGMVYWPVGVVSNDFLDVQWGTVGVSTPQPHLWSSRVSESVPVFWGWLASPCCWYWFCGCGSLTFDPNMCQLGAAKAFWDKVSNRFWTRFSL